MNLPSSYNLLFFCSLFLSNLGEHLARAAFPEIDTRGFGNELATLSDGGAFADSGRTFRQEFCQRSEEVAGGGAGSRVENRPTVATALAGIELRPSIVPGPYFLHDDENGIDPVYPGIHARMLDYIAERGNFTWRKSFGAWTREEKGNRTITELLVYCLIAQIRARSRSRGLLSGSLLGQKQDTGHKPSRPSFCAGRQCAPHSKIPGHGRDTFPSRYTEPNEGTRRRSLRESFPSVLHPLQSSLHVLLLLHNEPSPTTTHQIVAE